MSLPLGRRSAVVVLVVLLMSAVTFVAASYSSAASTVDIVILGGESAVSNSVASELATCTAGSVSRIAGSNRYATAAAVSSTFLSPGIDKAYVATGENFPDALAGSAAAGAGAGGPVLLVRPTSVPSETAAELNRLNPNTIVVLGGTAAISAGVESTLGAYGTVVRVAGSNRYSTGALVSSYAFPSGANTAYVATGTNFPDALAGGPAAVQVQGPVLLVDPNSIPSSVGAELARLGLSSIKVLGGTAAVSASVEAGLKAYAPSVTRLSGSNRYATAAAVSKDTFAPGVGTIFIATGTNFPDALAGGPIAGILGGPILLTDPNSIPSDTRTEIQRLTGMTCGSTPTTTTTTIPATDHPQSGSGWKFLECDNATGTCSYPQATVESQLWISSSLLPPKYCLPDVLEPWRCLIEGTQWNFGWWDSDGSRVLPSSCSFTYAGGFLASVTCKMPIAGAALGEYRGELCRSVWPSSECVETVLTVYFNVVE